MKKNILWMQYRFCISAQSVHIGPGEIVESHSVGIQSNKVGDFRLLRFPGFCVAVYYTD